MPQIYFISTVIINYGHQWIGPYLVLHYNRMAIYRHMHIPKTLY